MNEAATYPVPKVRLILVRESTGRRKKRQINGPRDAYLMIKDVLAGYSKEVFVVLSLDARNRVIHVHHAGEGSATACIINPTEVFVPAMMSAAVAVILAHNHPSGSADPSDDDEILHERMKSAGSLLGVPVIDGIIVGDREWWSFVRQQLHKERR